MSGLVLRHGPGHRLLRSPHLHLRSVGHRRRPTDHRRTVHTVHRRTVRTVRAGNRRPDRAGSLHRRTLGNHRRTDTMSRYPAGHNRRDD
ncbi:hypothetical protein, partial [Streptomyces sp. NPDC056707]|uniref:hypothetical protein n=1 Tax=Streptomyces sp. NPDC056707 TaxID=3345919 RepID=UPI0036AFC2CF